MDRKQEFRDFLATRRALVTPEQAGIPSSGGDRRVPGLRREEVALLAGVSVDYYTRLERAKVGGASESVLDGIAQALRLNDSERAHLFDLARAVADTPRTRRQRQTKKVEVSHSVQRVLDSMDVPAVIQNGRLDLLAANDLGQALYSLPYSMAQQPPNLARFIFLDPRAESFYVDYELARNLTVAMLRSTAGRDPLDKAVTDLIGELSTRSSDFGTRWAKHNVYQHASGRKVLNHPVVGRMDLAFDDFALPGDPTVSICTFTAEPGTPAADGLALLATWAETQKQLGAGAEPLRGAASHTLSDGGGDAAKAS